jgi:hypothetical protein
LPFGELRYAASVLKWHYRIGIECASIGRRAEESMKFRCQAASCALSLAVNNFTRIPLHARAL